MTNDDERVILSCTDNEVVNSYGEERIRVPYGLIIRKGRLDDPEQINGIRVFLPSGFCAPFIRLDAWEKWKKGKRPVVTVSTTI